MADIETWRLHGRLSARLGAYELHPKYNAKDLTRNARARRLEAVRGHGGY